MFQITDNESCIYITRVSTTVTLTALVLNTWSDDQHADRLRQLTTPRSGVPSRGESLGSRQTQVTQVRIHHYGLSLSPQNQPFLPNPNPLMRDTPKRVLTGTPWKQVLVLTSFCFPLVPTVVKYPLYHFFVHRSKICPRTQSFVQHIISLCNISFFHYFLPFQPVKRVYSAYIVLWSG